MARIFLAWELGEGYGHLRPLASLANELEQRGHAISMAARQLGMVARVFREPPAPLFQAPVELKPAPTLHWPTLGFADILHNVGFDDGEALAARVRAWQTLMTTAAAERVIINHAPTAVLAAHCLDLPATTIGNGFEHPLPGQPLPLFPHSPDVATCAQVQRTEQQLLDIVNVCLREHAKPPLAKLADLFHLPAHQFLTTLAEGDHFGPRHDATYYGVAEPDDGAAPPWPPGDVPCVFAYLVHTPALEAALRRVLTLPIRLLVVHRDIPRDVVQRLDAPNVRFTRDLVDLEQVADQAALALLNANHATTCQLLTGGLPCVLAPLQVEQSLFARRLLDTGAVLSVDHRDASRCRDAVQRMLRETTFRSAARTLADRYPPRYRSERRAALLTALEASLATQ